MMMVMDHASVSLPFWFQSVGLCGNWKVRNRGREVREEKGGNGGLELGESVVRMRVTCSRVLREAPHRSHKYNNVFIPL
jgi:hypothetical protein